MQLSCNRQCNTRRTQRNTERRNRCQCNTRKRCCVPCRHCMHQHNRTAHKPILKWAWTWATWQAAWKVATSCYHQSLRLTMLRIRNLTSIIPAIWRQSAVNKPRLCNNRHRATSALSQDACIQALVRVWLLCTTRMRRCTADWIVECDHIWSDHLAESNYHHQSNATLFKSTRCALLVHVNRSCQSANASVVLRKQSWKLAYCLLS